MIISQVTSALTAHMLFHKQIPHILNIICIFRWAKQTKAHKAIEGLKQVL